jgi:hypothetical protein
MFSQLKHHDHGDRSRGLARLIRSLPGSPIMMGGFAGIAARAEPGNGWRLGVNPGR